MSNEPHFIRVKSTMHEKSSIKARRYSKQIVIGERLTDVIIRAVGCLRLRFLTHNFFEPAFVVAIKMKKHMLGVQMGTALKSFDWKTEPRPSTLDFTCDSIVCLNLTVNHATKI